MRINLTGDYGLSARATFDPVSLTVGSMAMTAAAGGISAAGTLAGGSYAAEAGRMQRQAANAQADQVEQNASQAIASGQRKMFDTQEKTRLAISTARARGAASGVNIAEGAPAEVQGELAERGSYHALMDMFNGESTASGLMNQAAGIRYSGKVAELEGEQKQSASYLAAAGTLAGSAGSMMSTYGKFAYPTTRGSFGA